MLRPLLLNYQNDANVLTNDDQFMIGDDLLAAPILAPGRTFRLVYLPEGLWYDYWTGKRQAGGAMIQVEAPWRSPRCSSGAGAVIPMGPEMNYVGEKPADPITFKVYPDEQGHASTQLYEDDGLSPAYRQGVFRRTRVAATKSGPALEIALDAPEGAYNPGPRRLAFEVPAERPIREALLDGAKLGAANWRLAGGVLKVEIATMARLTASGCAEQQLRQGRVSPCRPRSVKSQRGARSSSASVS